MQIHCISNIKMYLGIFVLQKIYSLGLPLNNEVCKGPTDFNALHLFHTVCVVGG